MDRFVAHENIRRFELLLAAAASAAERAQLCDLLAEEKRKLALIEAKATSERPGEDPGPQGLAAIGRNA